MKAILLFLASVATSLVYAQNPEDWAFDIYGTTNECEDGSQANDEESGSGDTACTALSGGSLDLIKVTIADDCQIFIYAQGEGNDPCDADDIINSYDADDLGGCIIIGSAFDHFDVTC